jgi:hypothetical protein
LLTHVQHKLKNQSKHFFDNVKKHDATLKNVTIERIFWPADKTKKIRAKPYEDKKMPDSKSLIGCRLCHRDLAIGTVPVPVLLKTSYLDPHTMNAERADLPSSTLTSFHRSDYV